MTVRYATPEEIDHWNSYIVANPDGGNMFASLEFALQKETGGYKAIFAFVGDLAVTILEKNTPPLGKLWYLPKGPGVTSTDQLIAVIGDLTPFAREHGVFVIRVEPELPRTWQPALKAAGLIKARPIIPNPSTIKLNLNRPIDQILASLPQSGRYSIKRAERDGVTAKLVESSDANCQQMFNLLSATAEGQFGIRSYEYYHSFWQRFASAGSGQLFFAYVNGQVVAGAYAVVLGTKSTYKDGASIRERTAYGASHYLQWQVIEWAKSRGAQIHDFCGSPPSDEINNPSHKHYGVGLFKTAFNKEVTDYIGCYDAVLSPTKYKLWTKLGERIAHRLHYRKHHDSYY